MILATLRAALAVSCFGVSTLAFGQDLSGKYTVLMHEDQPDRMPGPELGDFAGLPINAAARQQALSWVPTRMTLPEHQCRSHSSPYIFRGPLSLRIWEERDTETQVLVKTMMYIATYEQTREIYMDGRPHPSKFAPHTWMGFSTGRWEGNILRVETTHIKQMFHRRNGLPQSDHTTLTEFFSRQGDYLTRVSVTRDPDYLAEPLIKSESFLYNPGREGQQAWTWPCEVADEVVRPQGYVPHYLPGKNPFLEELAQRWNISAESFAGGPETMYPEYVLKHNVRGTRAAP